MSRAELMCKKVMTTKTWLLCIFCVMALPSQAQNLNQDFRIRNANSIYLDLPRKFGLAYSFEQRYQENGSQLSGLFHALQADYRLNKNLQLAAEFRVRYNQQQSTGFRETFAISYELKLKKKNYLDFRLKLLNYHFQYPIAEHGLKPAEQHVRFRTRYSYKVSKHLQARASVEGQWRIDDAFAMTQIRNRIGIEWEAAKNFQIELNYFNQLRLRSTLQSMNHIAELNLQYRLKISKKN